MQYWNVSLQSKYVHRTDLIKACLGMESKLLNSAESKRAVTLILCGKESVMESKTKRETSIGLASFFVPIVIPFIFF